MSVAITEACVTCGACLWECPTEAIAAGDPRPVVDETWCTECFGFFGESQCIVVCPVDAIHVRAEPLDELAQRYRRVAPDRQPEDTWIWRRIERGARSHSPTGRFTSPPMAPTPMDVPDPSTTTLALSGRRISRDPGVVGDRTDGEMLLCHTGTGEFYTLNQIGEFIWELCSDIAGDELLRRVCGAFVDEDKAPIIAATEEFVAFLRRAGLVNVSPADEEGDGSRRGHRQ